MSEYEESKATQDISYLANHLNAISVRLFKIEGEAKEGADADPIRGWLLKLREDLETSVLPEICRTYNKHFKLPGEDPIRPEVAKVQARIAELEQRVENLGAQAKINIAAHPEARPDDLPPRPTDPCQCACGCELHVFEGKESQICAWCEADNHQEARDE